MGRPSHRGLCLETPRPTRGSMHTVAAVGASSLAELTGSRLAVVWNGPRLAQRCCGNMTCWRAARTSSRCCAPSYSLPAPCGLWRWRPLLTRDVAAQLLPRERFHIVLGGRRHRASLRVTARPVNRRRGASLYHKLGLSCCSYSPLAVRSRCRQQPCCGIHWFRPWPRGSQHWEQPVSRRPAMQRA